MRFLLTSFAVGIFALGGLGVACSSSGDAGSCGVCAGAAAEQLVVTFPCGKAAPATLAAEGSCQVGPAYDGAPTLTFVTDGVCHVSALFADGTAAELDVSRTTTAKSCCGDTYAYAGLASNDGFVGVVPLGGAACADAGYGVGYAQDGGH